MKHDADIPIYTLDLETDPFKHGRVPKPFCAGFYDGQKFHSTWGRNCIAHMHDFLKTVSPGIIYVHNGGRFDFHYLFGWANGDCKIINNRVVEMPLLSGHTMRDSYAILPIALAEYQKDSIDYNLLESRVREKNKPEILKYLRSDCKYLWQLVTEFISEFGIKLTIGGTAMGQLRKMHDFDSLDKITDFMMRDYFFGGRVQCFEKGDLAGNFEIYDVNSMYPSVMKNYKHPISLPSSEGSKISKHTCFLTVEGRNYGAFPKRDENGSLRFDVENGVFFVSIHEWEKALSLNLFKPKHVHETIDFNVQITFADFVDRFYSLRKRAKANGDLARTLFYKLVLNSAYGKFAQNPADFRDYKITSFNQHPGVDWDIETTIEDLYVIWSKRTTASVYYNTATAASITGGARSIMMEAVGKAKRPVYCDTDSLICEGLSGVAMSDTELGAWKYEGKGNHIAIAGKKMYALFDGDDVVKYAHKGVKITPEQIVQVAQGGTIVWQNIAPSLSYKRKAKFIERRVRLT